MTANGNGAEPKKTSILASILAVDWWPVFTALAGIVIVVGLMGAALVNFGVLPPPSEWWPWGTTTVDNAAPAPAAPPTDLFVLYSLRQIVEPEAMLALDEPAQAQAAEFGSVMLVAQDVEGRLYWLLLVATTADPQAGLGTVRMFLYQTVPIPDGKGAILAEAWMGRLWRWEGRLGWVCLPETGECPG